VWGIRVLVALAAVGLLAVAAGCAFESQIAVQFREGSPVVVTESGNSDQSPHRIQGMTTRNHQILRIDCSITIIYDVNDFAGPAVLAQSYDVDLRTRRLRRRTAYDLDCMGPLIVELPAEASDVGATATSTSGQRTALPVQAAVDSVALAFGRHLRAEPGTHFALVGWPRTLSPGQYQVDLTFNLPDARSIQEKTLYTASVSCGHSGYVQPILPPVTSMASVPAVTIQPSSDTGTFVLPHIVRANGLHAEAARTLSCAS
jgi:hypothetical protein